MTSLNPMRVLGPLVLLLSLVVGAVSGVAARDRPEVAERWLEPAIGRQAIGGGEALVVDLPLGDTAPLYRSPTRGGFVADVPGGSKLEPLGPRVTVGYMEWRMVRDPDGQRGWMAGVYLGESWAAQAEPPAHELFAGEHRWRAGDDIVACANPAGAPDELAGGRFVALVARAFDAWQEAAGGRLPLRFEGACDRSPTELGDGVSAVGWVEDLGLVIAGEAQPLVEGEALVESDVRLSRQYLERLQARDSRKDAERCTFSTLVHEVGHVLGLGHPRAKRLPSSMQSFGAARCDRDGLSLVDQANVRMLYGVPGGTEMARDVHPRPA